MTRQVPSIVTISGTRQATTVPPADVAAWRAVAEQVQGVTCLWAGPDLSVSEPGFRVFRSPRRQGPRSLVWVAHVAAAGIRVVRQSPGRVVLNGGEPWGWLAAWLVSLRTGAPWVMDIHASYLDLPAASVGRTTARVLRRTVKFFAGRATARRAVSFEMADRLGQWGLPTHWIPPRLLPLWEQSIPPRDARTATRPTRFIAIGRLVHSKGFDLLIEALAIHTARGGRATLTIVGDGPDRSALDAMVLDLGVSESVRFTGGLTSHRVRQELLNSDVFVLSSRDEGLPRTLLEAASCEIQIVATNVGGVQHAVGDWATVAVVPATADALADALFRTKQLAPRKELEAVRRQVLAQYGFHRNINELVEMYCSVAQSYYKGGPSSQQLSQVK